jgi:hypothetical protein
MAETWEERMGAKARARREAQEAEERARLRAEQDAEQERQAAELAAQRVRMIAEGPPCEVCYLPEPVETWHPYKAVMEWGHGEPVDPVTEVDRWPGGVDYTYVMCTHACHGEPYCTNPPVVAYAAG